MSSSLHPGAIVEIERGVDRQPFEALQVPPAAANDRIPHLDMLRRVTRQMSSAHDLHAVLSSIATALIEHAGANLARIFLYATDDACDVCRTEKHQGFYTSNGQRCLHLVAAAGDDTSVVGPTHLIPIDAPIPVAEYFRGGVPILVSDVQNDPRFRKHPEAVRLVRAWNYYTSAAFPLLHKGEPLGMIGMLSRRAFEASEFELLGIFADQAAMAIKSAFMFRELDQYRERLQVENAYLQEELSVGGGFEGIVGESSTLRGVLRKVKQVAAVETTVLLTGETGTGKELIARAIHDGSPRKDRALIKVNCGAIPQGVVESELFGHEKGAFTGALQRRIGRFELADRGTLFMDEVGELPLDTQVKLLRVLQEQEFERVGSTKSMKVDVRLVAATNRDLEHEVANGRFRADLYYRLNVFPIAIPPLRERAGDIPLLVRHFLGQLQRKLAKPLKAVTPESMARLQGYTWPGNIRELQNVIERACVLATGPIVEIGELQRSPRVALSSAGTAEGPIVTLEENERAHIRRALAASGGRINGPRGAAAVLGINPSTLRSRMERLGLRG
jgi:formate hydrogenlyase transcriptional activator